LTYDAIPQLFKSYGRYVNPINSGWAIGQQGTARKVKFETNMIRPSEASSIRKSDIANVDLPVQLLLPLDGDTDQIYSYQNLFYQPRNLSTEKLDRDHLLTYNTNFFRWINREGQSVKYGR